MARDQLGAVGPDGERDQHIEVQIAQFFGFIPLVCVNLRQNSAGFQPVLLGRSKDGMASLKGLEYLPVHRRSGPAPKLGEHHGRVADHACEVLYSIMVAISANLVDQHRAVEDNEVIHRSPRTFPYPRTSSLGS